MLLTHPQVREVAAAREVRLALGRGRWLAHRWGRAPLAARPGGATLAASFTPHEFPEGAVRVNPTQACVNPTQACVNPTQVCVSLTQAVDAAWRNLTHALGALFCSALAELAKPVETVAPLRSPFTHRQLPGSLHRTGALSLLAPVRRRA